MSRGNCTFSLNSWVGGIDFFEHYETHDCSIMIITHHRHILQYLRPTRIHILSEGRVVATGNYDELMPKIEELGYERLLTEMGKHD